MKKIKLDSVLLFAFVIPFVMTVGIGPGETPYWLFGLTFLGLLSYLLLDVLNISQGVYFRWKQILLWAVILVVIGSAFGSAIIVRHQTAPIYNVHDIILQQESAIRFLLHGTNPYETTYFGTPMEQWHYDVKDINPALYHFVMQPLYLLFAIPFYLVSTRTIGFFDGRMPLLFLFLALLIIGAKLIKDKSVRLLFLTVVAFNPAMLLYTLEGRSDIFMYTFFFAGLYLLHLKRYSWSTLFMGLAFAVKQSAWPFLPFYVAFLYFKTKSVKKTAQSLLPFVVVFSVIVLPFFFWNPKAFLDSTIFYLSGTTTHSYPISGYGWGKVLGEFGFIKDLKGQYPFIIWQIITCVPLAILLIKYLQKKPTVGKLVLVYGIFLFVYWYFSRYFNNSHLGYLSLVFITSYFWPEYEDHTKK